MITATIYTLPHIAHWLTYSYGSPVQLPKGCTYRATFLSCLSKELIVIKSRTRVEITVNKNIVSTYGHTIAQDRHKFFTKILVEELDRYIYDFVNAHRESCGSIDGAVAMFQEELKFHEELYAFDRIRRRYFRYKSKLQNKFHSSVTKKS